MIDPLLEDTMGAKLALSRIYLNVSAEAAPPGFHTILQFGMRSTFKEKVRTSLNHTVAYEAQEVIRAIVSWMEQVPLVRRASNLEAT